MAGLGRPGGTAFHQHVKKLSLRARRLAYPSAAGRSRGKCSSFLFSECRSCRTDQGWRPRTRELKHTVIAEIKEQARMALPHCTPFSAIHSNSGGLREQIVISIISRGRGHGSASAQ